MIVCLLVYVNLCTIFKNIDFCTVEANQLSSPKKPFPVSPLSSKSSNSEMVFALPPADDEEWEDSGMNAINTSILLLSDS